MARTFLSRAAPLRLFPHLAPSAQRSRVRVRVGDSSSTPESGLDSSTSGSTIALALVALAVVIGTIVWASKSAAADFA